MSAQSYEPAEVPWFRRITVRVIESGAAGGDPYWYWKGCAMGREERSEFRCDQVDCDAQHDGRGVGDLVAPTGWGYMTFKIIHSDWSVRKFLCPKHAEKLKRYFEAP